MNIRAIERDFLRYVIVLLISILVLFIFNPVLSQNTTKSTKKPKIGLVLSGGGARGFAHIGVIKVLEEEGIDVEMIGGTSMGSIVGGLYAMGYSIDVIEEIALNTDWDAVLNDKINRLDLGVYEKNDNEIHIFSLAIKNRKVSIPPGLVYGQNTLNMLSELTAPSFQSHDFSDLNKPFLCVATDLISGKAIVMDTGNLAIAIRASMSVPSAFVPVQYGPYYLADGGLINNLPAKDVRKMGADVLIGVDIQTPLYEQSEIKNLVQVMSQSIFLNAENTFNENLKEIDLLIKPEIDPFTSMDFNRADSLILRGEKKARQMIPQIRAFMDSLGIEPSKDARRHINTFPELDMLYVDRVEVNGNNKVTYKYIISSLDIDDDGSISVAKLNDEIAHLYGTKLFHTINYSLKSSKNGETIIVINVEEASLFELNVGIHYNDYAKAGLLLNITGRNVGAPNGRFSFDLAVGKVSRLTTAYVIDNGMKPGFGSNINLFSQSGFVYNELGKKQLSFGMSVLQHQGYGLLSFNNLLKYRLGYEIEFNSISQGISAIEFQDLGNLGASLFTDLIIDKYDRQYFPNKGYYFASKFAFGAGETADVGVDDEGNTIYSENDFSYSYIDVYGSIVIPIGDHFIVQPKAYYRKNFGSDALITKSAAFGGFSQSYLDSYKPFPGYEFMELTGHTAFYPELLIRHNFWDKHYLSFVGRFLSLDLVLNKDITENDFYYGWQVKYTYYSMIGPVSFSMAEAYPRKRIIFDFSLGFWF